MKKIPAKKSRLLGRFTLPNDIQVFGELRLKGSDTVLRLRHEGSAYPPETKENIYGELHDLSKVSCIQCVGSDWGLTWRKDVGSYHKAEVFPHFVTVGNTHLQPDQQTIKAIHFTVNDLSSIFNDIDAFGHVIDSKPHIETITKANNLGREIPIGDLPTIAYFTGKCEIISVDTEIGRLSVNHCPSYNSGGPNGIFIKNRMTITVTPTSPVTLDETVDRIMALTRFLSVIAGRKQGIKSIYLEIATNTDQPPTFLDLYWGYAPKGYKKNDSVIERPSPPDIPLDAIRRPEEFSAVLKDWIDRDSTWRIPRVRYTECLRKGNSYDPDRMIAAANMFDLLPKESISVPSGMSPELIEAQAQCRAIFKKLRGTERDSVMVALSKMGEPSLPKKVLHRVKIVEPALGHVFPKLDLVAKTAVMCRNYFVHGGTSDFNYSSIEPLMIFLTDTLEFVFAASDLIEAGWDASAWGQKRKGMGHSFARYRLNYDENLTRLLSALEESP